MLEPQKMRGRIKSFADLAKKIKAETGESIGATTLWCYAMGTSSPRFDKWQKIERVVRAELKARKG